MNPRREGPQSLQALWTLAEKRAKSADCAPEAALDMGQKPPTRLQI